jgi:hypothetical protein
MNPSLKCPACQHSLSEVKLGSVLIDVCAGGCGGIWFDDEELKKVEQEHHNAAETVVNIKRPHQPPNGTAGARHCPRCLTPTLEKKIPRLGSAIEFDRCPQCHGYWLDHGSLEKLIAENQFYAPPKPGKRIFVSLEVVRFMHTVKIKRKPATRS